MDEQLNKLGMRETREICTSLVSGETITTDFKSRSCLQSGVQGATRLLGFDGLALLCRCRARWGLAFAAVPLHILHQDNLIIDWWVMALLMPCIVASIAEYDGVGGWTLAAIAMHADDIGFLLSRATLTLSRSDGGSRRGECRWRLDDSSSPAGTSVVVRGRLHQSNMCCRQPSEGLD